MTLNDFIESANDIRDVISEIGDYTLMCRNEQGNYVPLNGDRICIDTDTMTIEFESTD